MHYVQTTNGTRHYGSFAAVGANKNPWPGDEDTAQALCNASNKAAEKLGIDTRYEVVELDD